MSEGELAAAFDPADPTLRKRLTARIIRRAILAGIAGAGVVALFVVLAAPTYVSDVSTRYFGPLLAIGAPAMLAVAIVLAVLISPFLARHVLGWAGTGRSPDSRQIARVAAAPRLVGLLTLLIWVVVIESFTVVFLSVLDADWQGMLIPVALVHCFGGATSAVLAYLLTEQVTRPILVAFLPADTTRWPRALGTRRRLLLAWLMTAAIPVTIITVFVEELDAGQRAIIGPSIVSGCVGIVVIGFVVFFFVGQSITDPLDRLRAGFRRVASGDLDQHVPATDPGDLGLLQVGFNEMVAGLREREHMRDVFGRHVGIDVARLAIETGFDHGGARMDASAMFVDIIGSTAITHTKDPEAVVAILNRFFDAVVRVVAAEGGFVNKFQGDGALCIFGAPLEQADHAARALRAARFLAIELAPIGDVVAAIGVSSGDVIAGNVGTSDRYEYTIIGDAVNEASRLSDHAKLCPSHVLASERAVLAAGDEGAVWEPGEALQLRGRPVPTLSFSPRAKGSPIP